LVGSLEMKEGECDGEDEFKCWWCESLSIWLICWCVAVGDRGCACVCVCDAKEGVDSMEQVDAEESTVEAADEHWSVISDMELEQFESRTELDVSIGIGIVIATVSSTWSTWSTWSTSATDMWTISIGVELKLDVMEQTSVEGSLEVAGAVLCSLSFVFDVVVIFCIFEVFPSKISAMSCSTCSDVNGEFETDFGWKQSTISRTWSLDKISDIIVYVDDSANIGLDFIRTIDWASTIRTLLVRSVAKSIKGAQKWVVNNV
jgi:hypothetical protein